MRLIHLTDIHLSIDSLLDFQQFYLRALLQDLKQFDSTRKIDLILITGDLVDKGGQSFKKIKQDPYEQFNSLFVDPIINSLNLDYSRVYVNPGNHDVDESLIEEIVESGLRTNLNTIEKINEYVDKYKNISHSGLERTSEFKKYETKLADVRENAIQEITNFESNYCIDINGIKVGIACLNSAWRCSSKLPDDSLTIGTRQILNANAFNEKNGTNFNIALLHHPAEYISLIERLEVESFFQTFKFDILLSGHIHSAHVYSYHGPKGRLFVNISKSAFGNPRQRTDTFKPGYSIIDLEFLPNEVSVKTFFRKYVHGRVKFDKDIDTAENGEFYCEIPTVYASDGYAKLVKLTNKTYLSKLDNINTSLLIYGTDSIAPRDLNQLFVLPNLTDSVTKYDTINKLASKQPDKLYQLDELILYKQNLLISGEKESGKTTLLNKIFIEASNNFNKYQFISVKFNFFDLVKKEIKPLIKEFLNQPDSEEIEAFLLNGNILLIIDEYENADKYNAAKTKLKNFIRDYPLNKIIISSSIQIDELVTEGDTIFGAKANSDKYKEFKPIFIGSVGAKQFRELSTKWFKRRDAEWVQINLEKLIKVFTILKTPRTFFSISLFLWIIEKQESFRPVNKSNLVNRFLILILKGLRIEESEAGKYTFEKKIELLRELALEMYLSGDSLDGYSLSIQDVVGSIKQNFTLNQLKLNEQEKYEEFIDKGILKKVNGNEHVAFRYEAFFQYFLSLNIDKNKTFKEIVFKNENFLSFIDEIDYYTGSSRDDVETLKFSFEQLEDSFEAIDDYMTENLDHYFPKSTIFIKKDSPINIEKIRREKLSDSQIEESLGEQLDRLPVQDSIRVKKTVDSKQQFHKALELAARVLKNSENIQNPVLINNYLDVVINKTAKYGIFIQSIIADNIEKQKDSFQFPLNLLIAIAPVINQDMLLRWAGTDFLEVPLESKIKVYLNTKKGDFSEYELFLTMFMYFDLKLPRYIEYLVLCVNKIENLYINELFLIKITNHYTMRSNSSSVLEKLEHLMIILLAKVRNISKRAAEHQVNQIKKDKLKSNPE